jgi:hypothetical protein
MRTVLPTVAESAKSDNSELRRVHMENGMDVADELLLRSLPVEVPTLSQLIGANHRAHGDQRHPSRP